MFCNNCGRQLPDESQFCVGCGAKVEPVETPAVQSENLGQLDAYPAFVDTQKEKTGANTNKGFIKLIEKFSILTLNLQILIIVGIALILIFIAAGIQLKLENVRNFNNEPLLVKTVNSSDYVSDNPVALTSGAISGTFPSFTPAQELTPAATPTSAPEPVSEPKPETIPEPAPIPEPVSEPLPEPEPEPAPAQIVFNIGTVSQIITQSTSASNIAVSVIDLLSGETFETDNADTPFCASGFYIPLCYAVYNCEISEDILEILYSDIKTIMRVMDNDAANEIIKLINDYSSTNINDILKNNGFMQTSFNRNFGDVEASKNGYENYTSTNDAIRLLENVYISGIYKYMNADIQKDGIREPESTTVFAHSGQGIGTSYNVFAIMESEDVAYAIAVLTTDTGNTSAAAKNAAAPIISAVFENVQAQMEIIYGQQ